ncbi:hypothetical protein L1887_09300 [Cichorium endivia]|nr:hypothetical protein L1887_09300 [Cichorium endivia]
MTRTENLQPPIDIRRVLRIVDDLPAISFDSSSSSSGTVLDHMFMILLPKIRKREYLQFDFDVKRQALISKSQISNREFIPPINVEKGDNHKIEHDIFNKLSIFFKMLSAQPTYFCSISEDSCQKRKQIRSEAAD